MAKGFGGSFRFGKRIKWPMPLVVIIIFVAAHAIAVIAVAAFTVMDTGALGAEILIDPKAYQSASAPEMISISSLVICA